MVYWSISLPYMCGPCDQHVLGIVHLFANMCAHVVPNTVLTHSLFMYLCCVLYSYWALWVASQQTRIALMLYNTTTVQRTAIKTDCLVRKISITYSHTCTHTHTILKHSYIHVLTLMCTHTHIILKHSYILTHFHTHTHTHTCFECLPYFTVVNTNRARLRPTGTPGADYVNASFIDVRTTHQLLHSYM